MKHRTFAVAAIAAAVLALPASALAQKIQPGESIVADGAYCTLNWIYDGTRSQAGKVFAERPRTASRARASGSRWPPARSATRRRRSAPSPSAAIPTRPAATTR